MIPTHAVAAVLEELGKPLVLRTIKLPQLLPGQVLVKVEYSGACRSQVMEASGGRGTDRWLPHLLGHEGSGTVVAIGPSVTKIAVDDDVILTWIKGLGMDVPGAKYHCGDTIINSGPVTTFSNYTIVSENRLVKKPPKLPFDQAVLFGCALPTGAGMVLNETRPNKEEKVVVVGLGGIGLSAVMALKSLGVQVCVAVDISENKLKAAKILGATHVFNSSSSSFISDILAVTNNNGFDLCIESGGLIDTIELGFTLIRKGGGRLLFASHPPADQCIRIAPHDLISGKKIFGSWGGACKPDDDIPRFYSLIKKANIPLDILLVKKYKLIEINQALNDLQMGRVFRPLIEMEHG